MTVYAIRQSLSFVLDSATNQPLVLKIMSSNNGDDAKKRRMNDVGAAM